MSWLVYWFYVGGDVFIERFLVILIPIGIAKLLSLLPEPLKLKGLAPIVLPLMVVMLFGQFVIDPRFNYATEKYDPWVELGVFLSEHHAGETLATGAAGKIPFFMSESYVFDMLGLNDEYIAHQDMVYFIVGHSKYDADYILANEPELITSWVWLCNTPDCQNIYMSYGLTADKLAQNNYRLIYLLNTRTSSQEPNIIDTSESTFEEIKMFWASGYDYGVMQKVSE